MTTDVNEERLAESAMTVLGHLGGLATAISMQTGVRMGLFDTLRDHGPMTSSELAGQTELNERWLREWLYQQAAAGVVCHESGETFSLTPEMALVVADESTTSSMVGFLEIVDSLAAGLAYVPVALRTGLGQPYDAHGPEFVTGLERSLAVFIPPLLNDVLPAMPGVVESLRTGGAAADVGCGAGARTVAMAGAYPKSTWVGYDNSLHALARADQNLSDSGLTNLVFRNVEDAPLPTDHSLDLVTFCDVVHDMAFPSKALEAVHAALKEDGSVMVADAAVPEALTDRLAHPAAPMFYGASLAICMSSSMSEEGAEGIGTFGLAPSVLEAMAKQAGFTRFRRLDIEDPMQTYYELKP